ncbi:cyclase family protein [Paenarthrobacter sp. C1]|uniref:cyclase family protein n=1 Tax=Paenarthrobacter sp. C1 TaxID=3400220 RepID=UPI003BF5D533
MALLNDLLNSLSTGKVEIVDLTNKLSANTPGLTLPEPFPSPHPFELEELAAYDDRGPVWKQHNIHVGEHTGTHLDVPIHWITGRDGTDVSELPLGRLVGPAVVLDLTEQVAANPDFLLEVAHVKAWEEKHGAIPDNAWLLLRTGWDEFSQDQEKFLNADETGPHTPGVSAECARWLAEDTRISGVGVETLGIDAGQAHGMEPEMPMHHYLLGNDKYGITSLQNLAQLPSAGAVIVVSPLPIVGGTGSPARVYALVDRG